MLEDYVAGRSCFWKHDLVAYLLIKFRPLNYCLLSFGFDTSEIAKVLADSLIKLGGPESLDGKAVLAGIRRISKSYKDAYRILIHTGSRTNENGESIEGDRNSGVANSGNSCENTILLVAYTSPSATHLFGMTEPNSYKPNGDPYGSEKEYKTMMDELKPIKDIPFVNTCLRQLPIAEALRPVIQKQVEEWRENGVIKRAKPNTPHSSPISVVRKKNSGNEYTGKDHRVVIDCRLRNTALDPEKLERFPLPLLCQDPSS
ncbi:hypothetical protein INT46_010403 [Mucor plumbeus]|uniref:Uncharacterized protein n=1 Tax=Mucor plumbeus TaxID=97098 RepID=A0A8H7QKW8_9FUNG|nr:hypothetical protein INT46_010403 [Mucor plumbeus]